MAGPDYSSVGFRPVAVSVTPVEAVQRQSTTNIKATVKTAIQRYMAKFLDEDGRYRYLTKSVFPQMLKYVTDISFNENNQAELADNKQLMPIFKYMNEIKSQVPCIVIADSGITWKSPGLGFDQGTFRGDDKVVYRVVHVVRQVNITMLVAALDQPSAEALIDCVGLMFGELAGFTNGATLSDESAGGHWVARLPKMPELGSPEKNQIGDDPKDLVWTSTSSIVVDYEDSFLVPFVEQEYSIKCVSPDGFPERKFEIPSSVKVGRESNAYILNLRAGEDLSISDPSILMLKPGRFPGHYVFIGKKPGEVTVRLLDGGTSGRLPGGIIRPDVSHGMKVKVSY